MNLPGDRAGEGEGKERERWKMGKGEGSGGKSIRIPFENLEWKMVDKEGWPVKVGETGEYPYVVRAKEFGCAPAFYVCRVIWLMNNAEPSWVLDHEAYGLNRDHFVGEKVEAWARAVPGWRQESLL